MKRFIKISILKKIIYLFIYNINFRRISSFSPLLYCIKALPKDSYALTRQCLGEEHSLEAHGSGLTNGQTEN